MLEVEMIRNNHLVDPHLHIWGWEIPVYLFLGGLTAGIMILSSLLARYDPSSRSSWARYAIFMAPMILSVGMLVLFLDLAHKLHVFRFYTTFELSSPMSWGSWILLAIYPATLGMGLAVLTQQEADRLKSFKLIRKVGLTHLINWSRSLVIKHQSKLIWANVVLGVGLGVYTGILLSNLGTRAAWNSSLLGPLFLVSGFSTGAAFMLLLPLNSNEQHRLRNWDLLAIGIEIIIIGLYFIGLSSSGSQIKSQAANLFLGGKYTALFWSLVVIVGLVVPFLLEWVEKQKNIKPTILAPVLLLIGGLSLRWILVLAGQT